MPLLLLSWWIFECIVSTIAGKHSDRWPSAVGSFHSFVAHRLAIEEVDWQQEGEAVQGKGEKDQGQRSAGWMRKRRNEKIRIFGG